jgi:hypothetical protein
MLRTLQWVAFGGFSCSVTTCLIYSGVNGLTRDRGVASFKSPVVHAFGYIAPTPAADCKQALPTAAAIPSAVIPSLARSTIRALQTTFCAVFQSPFQSFTISRADRNSLDLPHRRRFARPRRFAKPLSATEHQ